MVTDFHLDHLYNNPLEYHFMNYWTYEESKAHMATHYPNIKTKAQFVKKMQGWAVGFLPLRPNKTYKDCGWVSWKDFLNSNF